MRRAALLLALLAAPPALAQALVESDRIDAVAVTLYRDPGRDSDTLREGWPGGYALVTETRTITLPAGPAVIRFVGVAEGMMPETAIVTGLPRRVDEKNRDARLLSPAALIDAYLKRRVMLRRTDRATGKVREQEAVIQSGPGGGVILTTSEGVEALGCAGLPERLTYPGIPADLSAKPVLSVATNSVRAGTVTVQLAYLAQGFDWSANYVASVADNGDTLDLFAWLTVINGGSQGFADAHTAAVAGGLNKEAAAALPKGPPGELHLQCWPMDVTSTHPAWGIAPPPPPPPPMMVDSISAEDIVVTAVRREASSMDMKTSVAVVMAEQEELGDLKLYRIPEPVTVAAQSQKQVAMIDRKAVRFARVYTGRFDEWRYQEKPVTQPARRVLRTENRDNQGLGLPLPAGRVAVFEQARGASLLVGETDIEDRAVGDEVELDTGEAPDVRFEIASKPQSSRRHPYSVRVTNARSTPETFELAIPYKLASGNAELVQRKGVPTWRVTVPANGDAKLDFALRLER